MIDAVAFDTPPQTRQTRAQEDAPAGFSFAAALGATEARAAKALEVHGAAPQASAAIGEKKARGDARNAPQTPAPETKAQTSEQPGTVKLSPESQASAAQSAPAAKDGAAAPAVATQSAAATPIAPAIAPGATQAAPGNIAALKADVAATRVADLARPSSLKAPLPTAPTQKPEAPTQDFAKLLARRLDAGATQFELRLDPPALGRVEASLRLGDNGENLLALKFDNQTTLDMFARDESTLRNALSSSGFEFEDRQFVFELTESDPSESVFAHAADAIYEPVFAAPFSAGAVDLHI